MTQMRTTTFRSTLFRSAMMCLVIFVVQATHTAAAGDFFLSSSDGNDSAAGTSATAAWKSLERASQAEFMPGDRLLLKAGDRWSGMLKITAQGSSEAAVIIGSFGDGDPPAIDGNGAEACLHLVNPSHVNVSGLRLTNRNGRYGIRLTAHNAGELSGVTISSMDISDIYRKAWDEPPDSGHGPYKYYGGMNAEVLRGEQPSWWNGLHIHDCDLHDLGTCGISIGSGYPLHAAMRTRRGRTTDSHPILNVVVERNTFRDIARDGAILRQCDGATLQSNDVIRTGRVSMSNGIWFWDCQNSVIRGNVGRECGVRGDADGGPFSIDYYCENCRIEDNFSHDNEGPAFMVFGNHDTGNGTVIRGNVSFNDATAKAKPGFAAVSMISTVRETIVEGNIVIAGPDTRVLLGHHDWMGLPHDVLYRGNVFIGNGRAAVDHSVLTGGRFGPNVFHNVPELPDGITTSAADIGDILIRVMERRAEVRHNSGSHQTVPTNSSSSRAR